MPNVSERPAWLRLSPQETIAWDYICGAKDQSCSYAELYAYMLMDYPSLRRPRLSDVLRHLEAKDLLSRGRRHGDWRISEEAKKRLAAQSHRPGAKGPGRPRKAEKTAASEAGKEKA